MAIPEGVTTIEFQAFRECAVLANVTIPESTRLAAVTIPNGVISIGASSFFNCASLTSVTIPRSVTTVEDYAFAHCVGLTGVYFEQAAKPSRFYRFRFP